MPVLNIIDGDDFINPAAQQHNAGRVHIVPISDQRLCRPEYPYGMDSDIAKKPVKDLAVYYGSFHEILTTLKCAKVVPLLCTYLESDMAAADAEDLFTDHNAVLVTHALTKWDDPSIEATVSDLAKRARGQY